MLLGEIVPARNLVHAMVSLLSNGSYSFTEAARLTGLQRGRVREWFVDRRRHLPVFVSDYGDQTEEKLISFHDLIEVFIAGQLRERGVSLQTVRKTRAAMIARFGVKHPFCLKSLAVAGGKVLYVDLEGSEREQVHDVLTSQRVFPEIIRPFLKRLDYDAATDAAMRWHIADGVELDPGICFGRPITSISKKPTYLLSAAFDGHGRDADSVARWFGVTREEVEAAVAFEAQQSA